MKSNKITSISMLLTIAITLNIVEIMLPAIPLFIPGVVIRLGLANIVTIIMIYKHDTKDAVLLQYLRIFLVSLLSGRFLSVLFFNSLLGGTLSLILMIMSKKLKVFSPVGVSVLGTLGHVLGQIIASMLILNMIEPLLIYLPILVLVSIPTGVITGYVSIKYFKIREEYYNEKNTI